MIHRFPTEQKQFQQNNRSDVLGNIWSSYHLNFQENLGTLRISPRLLLNTSTADDADLGLPVAFKTYDSRYWSICGTRVFKSSSLEPQATFTEDTSTNYATDFLAGTSDMEVYAGLLFAATDDDLMSKVANGSGTGSWTTGRMTLGNYATYQGIHKLCYFKKFDRLYISDETNVIKSLKVTGGVFTTVTSPGDYYIDLGESSAETVITSVVATSDWMWIGTLNNSDRSARGSVLQWDGISAQATNEYKIDAQGVMAMCVDNNQPYAIDSNGTFLEFNGSSFKEPNNNARLPTLNTLLVNIDTFNNTRFIHPNGFIPTKNGTFLALINGTNGDNTGTQNENLPSGVWEFDYNIGWTHKSSPSYTPVTTSTITDFGQQKLSAVGALVSANTYSTGASRNGTIMAGVTYFTNASSTANGIFIDDSNDTVQKKGYFATGIIEADEIEEKFNRIWAKYKRFLNANDKIVFKYRNFEEEPVTATITWTSTTSFTTSTDITAYGVIGDTGVGYEVEILQGTGSGSTAHITNITGSGPYTVTIDETITGVTSGTAIARFQKWIKIGEIPYSVGSVKQWEQLAINNSNDTQIQVKGCFTFTGKGQLDELITKSEPNQKITN